MILGHLLRPIQCLHSGLLGWWIVWLRSRRLGRIVGLRRRRLGLRIVGLRKRRLLQ